ncbi:hypothetical protein G3M48_001046 [Beauveria asiatica]|uniref:Rad60/SUMO-like domain-containing protein n=1 Tax=Beauveria asiatica TaxID=1069075 RepID=A0AAW0S1S3_9HYPO
MAEDNGGLPGGEVPAAGTEHLNIKVTDNHNEIFFKIKRTTKLEKLMTAFCDRQGKSMTAVRFLFDGTRVQPTDTPDNVRLLLPNSLPVSGFQQQNTSKFATLEMADGDTLEVHQEQLGGAGL